MTTKTKARPILFSAPMIRALLAGTKTQTRRVVKPQPSLSSDTAFLGLDGIWRFSHPTRRGPVSHEADDVRCPYGAAGDLLWVRETWLEDGERVHYRADTADMEGAAKMLGGWRPSIFMPRQHSRITLRITEVRVQRLMDISAADATAEGVERESADPPFYYVPGLSAETGVGVEELHKHPEVVCYSKLWEHINGAGSWAANPWVWAIRFDVIHNNVTEIQTNE